MIQLARGLDAIHRAGQIHRDIKSSNVLITREGRVLILDFGLITDGDRAEHGIVGTAHFMAPEQAAGQAVGPAADWYSVGVLLFAALTGALPFQVSRDAVLVVKQFSEPEPPSALVQGLPDDLEQLCIGLLRHKPEERASSLAAFQSKGMGDVDSADVPSLLSDRSNFVGRARELQALTETLELVRGRRAAAAFIEGESGMGKSALVAHYLDSLGDAALVFRGRCYERDSVPYKAVDEIISALAYYLESLPEQEAKALLPPEAGLLALIFPELDIAASVASMPRPARDVMDPVALRNAAFGALRALFHRIARTRLVILAIDDLQWTDADSVVLLEEILGPPDPPPLLFLCTMRPAPEGSPPRLAEKLRDSMASVTTLRIGGLSSDDAQQLVSTLLQGAELPEGIDASTLIGEAGGHPFFIDALVRHRIERGDEDRPLRLDDALWSRVQRLDPATRQLIEVIAVAGAPTALDDVAAALDMSPDRVARSVVPLQAAKLVHLSSAGAEQRLESYHDRVRETVVSRISEQSRRSWHRALATALEKSGRAEAETMAIHWREAGEHGRAADYAARGGDQATNALAFDLAARLYRMALELRAEKHLDAGARALMIKLGDALYNAGRGGEAARVFVQAYEGAPPAQRLELTRRAAECFLHAGYVKEGIEHLKPVLASAHLAPFRPLPATIAAFVYLRLRLRLRGLKFVHRREHEIDPEVLRRIDICWGLSLSMSFIDALRGAYYQLQSLLLALDAGEPLRISRALAVVATFNSLDGVSTRGHMDPMIAEVFRTAELCGHPYALAFAHGSRGFIRFNQGRLQEGSPDLDRGVKLFSEKCVGAWTEHGQTLLVHLFTLWFLGDLTEFSRRAADALRHAEDHGNLLLATNLSSGIVNGRWLMEDKPEQAAAELQR
ncbi:MAG: AAA family ATPase, partial [Byssovorax sp.]